MKQITPRPTHPVGTRLIVNQEVPVTSLERESWGAAAMRHDEQASTEGEHNEGEGNKEGDQQRKSRDIREDECSVILRDCASPRDKRTCLCLPMVTGLMVAPGMEVKTSGGRLFKIDEAGMTKNSRNQADSNQEAGHDDCRARRQTRSSML